jgi:hypothetical protein
MGPLPCLYLYAGVADVHVKNSSPLLAHVRFILSSGQKAIAVIAGAAVCSTKKSCKVALQPSVGDPSGRQVAR